MPSPPMAHEMSVGRDVNRSSATICDVDTGEPPIDELQTIPALAVDVVCSPCVTPTETPAGSCMIPNTQSARSVDSSLSQLDSIHDLTKRQIEDGGSVVEVWENVVFDLDLQHILACHAGVKRHASGCIHIAEEHILENAQAHTPLLVYSLILSISFPLGFLLGACPLTGAGKYICPFTIGLLLCPLAGWAVAWEKDVLFWAFKLWAVWAFIFWAPLQLLYARFGLADLRMLFTLFSAAVTLPWPLGVMKLCNYKCISLRKSALKLSACLGFQTVGTVLLLCRVIFDSCWLSKQENSVAQLLRPFILYGISRVSMTFLMVGMNFHPSPVFRITYLIFGGMFLASVNILGAARSASLMKLLYYLGCEGVPRLMSFCALAISGTALLKKHRSLQWMKWVITLGGPRPYHGMDALQYSCLAHCTATLCSIACICGVLMLWFFALRWIDEDSAIKDAVDFWFPNRDETALQLSLFLLRETFYEWLVHKIVTFKTGIRYRGVFVRWLDKDSCIGWSTLLYIALASTLGPGAFTVFSHFAKDFSEFAAQLEL